MLKDFPQDLYHRLSDSFEANYRGAAVEGFHEHLTQNERLFKTMTDPCYYAKFCSIVQSSGTGKSRLLTELCKKNVIVVYINLRPEKDKLSFPLRDLVPSKILTEFPPSANDYRIVCYAFFTALFDTVEAFIHTSHTAVAWGAKENIMNWVHQMCDLSHPPRFDVRPNFFHKFQEKYKKVYADHVHVFNQGRSATAGNPLKSPGNVDDVVARTDADKVADKLRELTISDPPDFTNRLLDAYRKMAKFLGNVFAGNSDHPKLVVALDEAHPLTPTRIEGSYRPADLLCRVINEYSRDKNHAVWVVFASTTSKVTDFSPPNQIYNSDRVAIDGERLFPPYTQLGWDQNAFGIGDVDMENISKIDHIISYGRPLWVSLKSSLARPERVLKTASSELRGGHEYNPEKMNHVLALLGQRFGLNVVFGHPESVGHLEAGVASHLLICLGTTLDRNWRFTVYPSEPLLSCVAATDLHGNPEKFAITLTKLLKAVNSGMIDMGQRGELASRLLWLLAKDLFVRRRVNTANEMPSQWDEHLIDCEMIPVVDWFGFIFGPKIWDEEDAQVSLARQVFKDACQLLALDMYGGKHCRIKGRE